MKPNDVDGYWRKAAKRALKQLRLSKKHRTRKLKTQEPRRWGKQRNWRGGY